jgi:hypothetical protein
VRLPGEYFEAIHLTNLIFPSLYQLENGLRLIINNHLGSCYGDSWWDHSLQRKRPDIFVYAQKQRTKLAAMPWIGAYSKIQVLPVHLVTLGQLEEIIKAYRSDCIPELFPTLEFFLGHMELVKRVRNMYTHMFPCITENDCRVARSEIRTLALHINSKLA